MRWLPPLLLALAVSACGGPDKSLPPGPTGAVLGSLKGDEAQNRRRVVELEAAGKWEELARFADENVAKDVNNPDWWFVLGHARTQLGRHAAAAEAFATVTRLEPDNIAASNYLGQAYRLAGDPRRAVNALTRALNIRRDSPGTLYLLGESYSDLLRHDEAAAAYREAVALAPQFSQAWFSLARAYMKLGRSADAQAARERLQKLDPKLAAQLNP